MFEHYAAKRPKDLPTSTWSPKNWTEEPVPALILEKPRSESPRYIKAVNSRRNKFPKKPKDQAPSPGFVARNRNCMMNLAIMGLAVGWENVFDDSGKPVPFPQISHEDPNAAGNKLVREFIKALGVDNEESLAAHCLDDGNWALITYENDEEEDAEGADPLASKSRPG